MLRRMPDTQTGLILRDSRAEDIPALTRIYAHSVRHGLASFELEPPDAAEMARRREAVLAGGYPHLLATDAAGEVLGYAYASAYRSRPAYRFAVENSVYVAPEAGRRGIGRALLPALVARCTAAGFRLMVAVIGDSGNAASIGLHAGCGFRHAGLLPAVGWKHGRWVDSVLMTLPLGEGAAAPPRGETANAPG
jgi:L-amino acid N-acyltransferase YncA